METKTTADVDVIQFKPLTEGLGLNHFADGLPYSPSQSPQKMRRAIRQTTATPVMPPMPTAQTERKVLEEIQNVILQETEATVSDYAMPAGALRRSFAYLTDAAVVQFLYWIIVSTGFTLNDLNLKTLLFSRTAYQLVGPLFLLNLVFYFGYFLIQEVTWKTSLGKILFGIKLESRSAFAGICRVFCFLFSFLPLGLGLVWYFFDPRKRCWHDVVTNTDVVVG